MCVDNILGKKPNIFFIDVGVFTLASNIFFCSNQRMTLYVYLSTRIHWEMRNASNDYFAQSVRLRNMEMIANVRKGVKGEIMIKKTSQRNVELHKKGKKQKSKKQKGKIQVFFIFAL